MRLRKHASLLNATSDVALNRARRSLLCDRCRRFSSAPPAPSAAYPHNIAVLGGGISGLASAYYVSKEFPKSKITIYEANKELGGWIRSKRVDVPGGNVLFEYGPRSLRPVIESRLAVKMIQDLGLTSDLVTVDKSSPSARNRYLYYPDRINVLPGPGDVGNLMVCLFGLWRSGLLEGTLAAAFESMKKPRPSSIADESVGSFISRRFHPAIAANFVSAVFHGIYAGDIWKLSARALLPLWWELEGKYGSIFQGIVAMRPDDSKINPFFLDMKPQFKLDQGDHIRWTTESIDPELGDRMAHSSIFSLKDGLQQLACALEKNVQQNPQVTILKGLGNNGTISVNSGNKQQVDVEYANSSSPGRRTYDLAISTVPQKTGLTKWSTVMTVNLWYPTPKLVSVQGFGYLIPQSIPFEQNPERALGVIFDSDSFSSQDTVPGTKLTVMLGGHWWDAWEGYPDEQEGIQMAKSVLERHLGITAEPAVADANLHTNCIPQYNTGYSDELAKHAERTKVEYNGRVRVVNNQLNGVGVNDCITGAWQMARDLSGQGWKKNTSGIDHLINQYDTLGARDPVPVYGKRLTPPHRFGSS